jgi:hypothetical protein
MFEKRKSQRKKMVLPVKISIDKVTHLAHTLDITGPGARLGGLRAQLQPGMNVILHRGSKKANFRIKWVQQLAPSEMQAGIECLEPQEQFWGVDLSDQEQQEDKNFKALMTVLSKSKSASV